MNTNFFKLPLNEIFLGDCLTLLTQLPDECVDLVVSSPPYNLGKEYEAKKALEKYLEEQTIILQECSRILKKTGSIFWQVEAFSHQGSLIPLDIRFFPILESFGLIPRNRIMWIRQHGLHAKNKFSCRHETILWFTKSDDYTFNLDTIRVPQKYQNKKYYKGNKKGELSCNPKGKNPGNIWLFRNVKHNHEEQTIHPCQFPEDLIARIILSTTKMNDIVFDSYMGSGTVAVVSKNYEQNFIGAEVEEKYYDIALRRLEEKPDKNNNFSNLKSLRNYVEKTGENIEKYRFDMQTGNKATERKKAKIFPEEYHKEELENRLFYEESTFSADLRGEDRPIDVNLNGRRKNKKVNSDQSSDAAFKQLEIEL